MTLLNDMHTDWDVKDNDTRPALATLHTDGKGYWSAVAKAVRVTELKLGYINNDRTFGELRVHFNTDDWRADRDGLIYSDKLFVRELREYLEHKGIPADGVSYSEQGMQGDNYVSCDVDPYFLDAWLKSEFAK